MKLKFSTANHSEAYSQSKQTNRIIEQILRATVNHRQNNWEDLMPACEFEYDNNMQESTSNSPFFLNFRGSTQGPCCLPLSRRRGIN